MIDQRVVDFYFDLIKRDWIHDIYNKLNKYIGISDDKIKLIQPRQNKLQPIEYNVERFNFILEKFITSDELHKFLAKFIKNRKANWNEITNPSENIKNDLIDYVENRIKLTLNIEK